MRVLQVEGVSRTFSGPPPVTALRACGLVVEAGDLVTLTGASGSGKSTFLNVIGLLDRPTDGRVLVDGIDTTGLRERQRTEIRGEKLGFVFQAFHLMPNRSALENVTLAGLYQGVGLSDRERLARDALQRVGMGRRLESPASVLSGGERQRVAIARAIAGSPRFLLCDEPTGNLDSTNSQAVVDLLVSLNRAGMTVIVVTHDPDVAAVGTIRLSMHDGVLSHVPQ